MTKELEFVVREFLECGENAGHNQELIARARKALESAKLNPLPVRFFVWPSDDFDANDYTECDENEFLEAEGVIEYERHTVFDNGVSQICLTKNPFANC